MPGTLTVIQDAVVKLLQSDTFLMPVKLLKEQQGDIRAQVQAALAKLGICAIAMTPKAVFSEPNAPGPLADPLSIWVDVYENVSSNRGANGSKLPCSDVAERVAWWLHYPNHAHERQDAFILVAKSLGIVPDKNFLVYRVEFETKASLAGIAS